METYPKVLLLDGNPDASLLEEILTGFATVIRVDTIPEALAEAGTGDYDVFLCPWEPAGGTWLSVLKEIQNLKLEIPVVVFHHCGCEQEWSEVLMAGGFDLLAPPYDRYRLAVLLEHARAFGHKMKDCCLS